MADDHRDTGDEHGDEIAEEHLAKERRPIEREEGADAAEGEGHDHDEAKGETRSDEKQAVAHSLHWETRRGALRVFCVALRNSHSTPKPRAAKKRTSTSTVPRRGMSAWTRP